MITRRRWFMLSLCVAGILVNYIDRSNFAVALPIMSKELGLTAFGSGVLLSAFYWLYTPGLLPVGYLSDRFGIRTVYGACMVLWSLASAAMGLGTGLISLLILRLVMGLAEAGSFPTNSVVVARWFPREQRGLATSIWHSGIGIGSALSFPIVAYLIGRLGWQASFAATGAIGVACGAVWYAFYRDPVEPLATVAVGHDTDATHSTAPALGLLKSRPAISLAVGYFLVNFANFFFAGWFPSYLMQERGVNLRDLANLGPVPTIAAIAGGLLGGIVADALYRAGWSLTMARKTCLIGGLLASCLIVPAALVSDLYLAIGLFSVAYAGISFTSANIHSLPPELAPSAGQVGTLAGMQMVGGAAAGIVSNLVIGALVQFTGSYNAPLFLLGILATLAILNYAFILGPVQPIAVGSASALRPHAGTPASAA